MERQIIFHGDYFLDFYRKLDSKVKSKIQYFEFKNKDYD